MGFLDKLTGNTATKQKPTKTSSVKEAPKKLAEQRASKPEQPKVQNDKSKFSKKQTSNNPKPNVKASANGPKQAGKKKLSPKPDHHTVQIVHDLLQSRFVKLFNKAKVDRKTYYKVLKLVTSDSLFHDVKTYNNVPMAKAVLNEVIGLGIISRIAEAHPTVTDVVFNGRFLTYQTANNKYRYGEQPGEDASILTPDYINQLINKFSNNAENHQSVNKTQPIFDGMYKDMRISVCFGGDEGLTPINYDSTFAIRITKAKLPLNVKNFSSFAPMFIYSKVLNPIIKSRATTMISGETGSAKTSLQKLIIGLIQQRERIVMIEDTPETHLDLIYPQKDVLDWITSEKSGTGIAKLVEESLRVDPNWVMVAEVRDGKSAYQMFQSVKTGHALMTTLHAKDNKTVPSRFAGMIREAMDVAEGPLVDDFLDYMDIGIHNSVKTVANGDTVHTFRFMDELCEFVPKSKEHPDGINVLFEQRLENHHGVAYRRWRTFHTSSKIKDTVRRNYDIKDFDMPFVDDTVVKDGKRVPSEHLEKVPMNNN